MWNYITAWTNDYYQLEIITWKYIIVYKLFLLDSNTWYHLTVYEKKNQTKKKKLLQKR